MVDRGGGIDVLGADIAIERDCHGRHAGRFLAAREIDHDVLFRATELLPEGFEHLPQGPRELTNTVESPTAEMFPVRDLRGSDARMSEQDLDDADIHAALK